MNTARVISSSPHIHEHDSVEKIMWTVVLALLPACVYGVYIFGMHAAYVLLLCVGAAVATEALIQKVRKRPVTVSDGSAVVTGLLVGCNVPPEIPLWLPVLGTVVAIGIAKHTFGGLGYNIFNPALIGRAFLMGAYPKEMTTWRIVGRAAALDATTTATPLGVIKDSGISELIAQFGGERIAVYQGTFFGNIGGCIGETSALLLLAGGLFLLFRRVITWHIPVVFLVTLAGLSWVWGNDPHAAFRLFSGDPLIAVTAGGAMLGAWFMATDMVTSPVTVRGQVVFAAGCGVLTYIIRRYGGFPEGVSYAILLMNMTVPLIDTYLPNRVYGTHKQRRA